MPQQHIAENAVTVTAGTVSGLILFEIPLETWVLAGTAFLILTAIIGRIYKFAVFLHKEYKEFRDREDT